MTEAAFQEARKVMRSANVWRGLITAAKRKVGKWTKMEMAFRADLKEAQADWAKSQLENAFQELQRARDRFASYTFPDPNLTDTITRCKTCGAQIPTGDIYCDNDECMC